MHRSTKSPVESIIASHPEANESTVASIPAARSRGRPTKPPSQNVKIDMQRSRVRRAQKAFRIRKEVHVKFVEGRVKALEDVVEKMSNVLIKVSDDILSQPGTSTEARETLRCGMEQFLELGRRAIAGEEDRDQSGSEGVEMEDMIRECELQENEFLRGEMELQDPGSGLLESQTSTPPLIDSLDFFPLTSQPTSAFRPFDCPISQQLLTTQCPDPVISSFGMAHHQSQLRAPSPLPEYSIFHNLPQTPQSGISAIPYILAGRDSFSAHLYFTTIVFVFRAIRGEPGYAESANFFFRHKLRYGRRARVITVVGDVVDTMLGGGGRIDTDTAYPNPSIPRDGRNEDMEDKEIKELILKDIEREGDRESDYLSTWEVEEYLKTKWRLKIDSSTVKRLPNGIQTGGSDPRTFAPTMMMGWGERDNVKDTRDLVEKLKGRAVTIGEGPRWSKRHVDETVRGFFNI